MRYEKVEDHQLDERFQIADAFRHLLIDSFSAPLRFIRAINMLAFDPYVERRALVLYVGMNAFMGISTFLVSLFTKQNYYLFAWLALFVTVIAGMILAILNILKPVGEKQKGITEFKREEEEAPKEILEAVATQEEPVEELFKEIELDSPSQGSLADVIEKVKENHKKRSCGDFFGIEPSEDANNIFNSMRKEAGAAQAVLAI